MDDVEWGASHQQWLVLFRLAFRYLPPDGILSAAETRDLYKKAPATLVKLGIAETVAELEYFGAFHIVASDGINTTKLQRFNRDGCVHMKQFFFLS